MSERSAKVLFDGLLDAIDSISQYTVGMDFGKFNQDKKTRDAVLMQLIVLGETANRVPADLKKILPEVEWGRIIRSINIISHEYQGIDYQIIWRIVTVYLPELKKSIQGKRKDFES